MADTNYEVVVLGFEVPEGKNKVNIVRGVQDYLTSEHDVDTDTIGIRYNADKIVARDRYEAYIIDVNRRYRETHGNLEFKTMRLKSLRGSSNILDTVEEVIDTDHRYPLEYKAFRNEHSPLGSCIVIVYSEELDQLAEKVFHEGHKFTYSGCEEELLSTDDHPFFENGILYTHFKDVTGALFSAPVGEVKYVDEEDGKTSDDFENRFWEVVDEINWGGRCKSGEKYPYNSVKEKLLSKYETEFLSKCHKESVRLRKELNRAVTEYSMRRFGRGNHFTGHLFGHGVSDDSLWDLTAHIVGLGKDTYYKVLNDPSKLADYPNYVENFEYCFNYAVGN